MQQAERVPRLRPGQPIGNAQAAGREGPAGSFPLLATEPARAARARPPGPTSLRTTAPDAYYDGFSRRLLHDYLRGNPRAEAATAFAVSSLPGGDVQVLDIGCGIGWSTFEIARHRPDAVVHGVDLSPRLVACGRRLFGDEERVRFDVLDFVADDAPAGDFDAIVLLDVYEHFPQQARAKVHAQLRSLLAENGRLLLSVPTVEHQRFLREQRPEGLQPIDEDVTAEDVRRLADDVGGRVVSQGVASIWRPGDYMHVAIERGRVAPPPALRVRTEPPGQRIERVERALGMRWTRTNCLVAWTGTRDVCIATTSLSLPQTQTFVLQHLEHLPARVHLATEALIPSPLARVVRRLARTLGKDPRGVEERLGGRIPPTIRTRLYRNCIRRHRIAAVLAEFGPMGVELHDACKLAGIPLVTHFHGFDAFRADVLARYRERYRAVFDEAWPVVAASESMKRHLVELGATPEQVHVVRYGIDLERFRPGDPTPGLVVTVGRFVEKKAPELAVRAFARAAEHVPEARLVMIGDGPLRPAVERLIADLNLEERVRLDGERDHGWVAQTLAEASVFMQHSLVAENGDREGTPLAVLEACATAVPVVATRHEGIGEVVIDGETGLLVEEGDVEGMSAALADLLLDPARARRLGLAARRRIEHSGSREEAIGRLWSILEQAIDASVPAS